MTIVAPCGGGCRCSGAIREGVIMADEVSRESARDPQDLERLLVSRKRAGGVNAVGSDGRRNTRLKFTRRSLES